MDIDKLTIEISSEKFYNTYVSTLRRLYDDHFIGVNHLMPNSSSILNNVMSKKANVEKIEQYDNDIFEAIIRDNNTQYEEVATGQYTEEFRKHQLKRLRAQATILKVCLEFFGKTELANKLRYTDDIAIQEDMFDQSKEDKTRGVKDETKYESINRVVEESKESKEKKEQLYAQVKDIQINNTVNQYISTLQDYIDIIKKYHTKYLDKTFSYDDLSDVIDLKQKTEEYLEDVKDFIRDKDRKVIKELLDIMADINNNLLPMLSQFIEEYSSKHNDNKEGENLIMEKKDVMAVSQVNDIIDQLVISIDNLRTQTIDSLNNVADNYEILEKSQNKIYDTDEERVAVIKELVEQITDIAKLKDVAMFTLMKTW